LHHYPSRARGVEGAAERGERAQAETARQTMDLDAGFGRIARIGCGRRPNVNAVAVSGESVRDQPSVIGDAALLGRILARDDVPGY
jgi:hypothetical protein